jgi:general secretion pathway protein G
MTAKRYCKHTGFTLLELLVVVAIIALLAGYVAPRYLNQLNKSEVSAARAQIDAFTKALDQYRIDVGRYPTTEQGLMVLYRQPGGEPKWAGPYLAKEPPLDPWGRPYEYRAGSAQGKDFEIVSRGKDGAAGGTGVDADLVN